MIATSSLILSLPSAKHTINSGLVRLSTIYIILISSYFVDSKNLILQQGKNSNSIFDDLLFVDKDLAKSVICSPQADQNICSRLEDVWNNYEFLSMKTLYALFCYANTCNTSSSPLPSSSRIWKNQLSKNKRSLCNFIGCTSDI
ncbi:unnamed protein product [Heterobilharzia americana]|nr:unnamed protein product [Heterobilharzia americana]